MQSAADLVREARIRAGLSMRALAERAGVPTSTVSRIEDGSSDPTLTMLQRVLGGASTRLLLDEAPLASSPNIAAIASSANRAPTKGGRRNPAARETTASTEPIDWLTLRGFADWADRHPEQLADAVADTPARTGTVLDAILAAFTEELATTHHIRCPTWTRHVDAVPGGWSPRGTPSMTKRATATTPEPFSRRGITLARSELFRQ